MAQHRYSSMNDALDDKDVENLLEEEEEQIEMSEYVSDSHHEDKRRARARAEIEDRREKQRLHYLLGDYYGDLDSLDDE